MKSVMRNRKSRRSAVVGLLIVAVTITALSAAQPTPIEHVFQVSRSEIDKALQNLRASSPGRLPILEGFVPSDVSALDKYRRAYFQYRLEIRPSGERATSVRVSAKVTAWYAGDNTTPAGYRALPSNGRLESDLIERLEEALQQISPAVASANATPSNVVPADRTAVTRPEKQKSPAFASLPVEPPASRASLAPPNSRDLAEQRRVQQLNEQATNLGEILRNQSRPSDLAAVLKSGTPVLAKPIDYGDVLFKADAEDEFKVLDESGDWVHVQVSGISRGWIRRSELEMPGAALENRSESAAASAQLDTHEETSLFPGEWSALRGRIVRIVWVRPESASASGTDRWQLARSIFRDAYGRLGQSNPKVDGMVIVIDAADGGMIAVTADSLRRWNVGALSDAAFRKECWTDSPEALGETARRGGKSQSQNQ